MISFFRYMKDYWRPYPAISPLYCKKPNLSYVDQNKNTLLHLALIHKKIPLALELLEKKPCLESKNQDGFSCRQLIYHLYCYEKRLMSLIGEPFWEDWSLSCFENKREHQLKGQQIHDVLGFKPLNHLYFSSYQDLRMLSYDLLKKHLDISAYEQDFLVKVYSSQFKIISFEHLYLRYISPKIGYGLFAKKELPKGFYIGEYLGKVHAYYPWHAFNSFLFSYSPKPYKRYTVNAKSFGSYTRFINHSYEPNCQVIKFFFENILHLGFFLKTPLKKDEQVLIDYGPKFWKRQQPQVF